MYSAGVSRTHTHATSYVTWLDGLVPAFFFIDIFSDTILINFLPMEFRCFVFSDLLGDPLGDPIGDWAVTDAVEHVVGYSSVL
jgi:hypothetical protein